MRLLLGMVLGAVLTIGGAYLYDSHHAARAMNPTTAQQRPLVNWDVVANKWGHLTRRARGEWNRIANSS
jgi:hypothetical protein